MSQVGAHVALGEATLPLADLSIQDEDADVYSFQEYIDQYELKPSDVVSEGFVQTLQAGIEYGDGLIYVRKDGVVAYKPLSGFERNGRNLLYGDSGKEASQTLGRLRLAGKLFTVVSIGVDAQESFFVPYGDDPLLKRTTKAAARVSLSLAGSAAGSAAAVKTLGRGCPFYRWTGSLYQQWRIHPHRT